MKPTNSDRQQHCMCQAKVVGSAPTDSKLSFLPLFFFFHESEAFLVNPNINFARYYLSNCFMNASLHRCPNGSMRSA